MKKFERERRRSRGKADSRPMETEPSSESPCATCPARRRVRGRRVRPSAALAAAGGGAAGHVLSAGMYSSTATHIAIKLMFRIDVEGSSVGRNQVEIAGFLKAHYSNQMLQLNELTLDPLISGEEA